MRYNPENLQRWKMPDSYFGAEWPEYFVFLARNRDSDSLVRSNFECALREIGGESETVIIVRESHWACGWIEWIAIHESDAAALKQADKISSALQDHPVVDEDHWSALEYDEACAYWESMTVRERAYYCEKAGISIFAARRDYLPDDPSGYLFESLTAA